jgi:hypothetical protein
MWKQLLSMTIVLAALVAWERVLVHRAAEQRRESARIESLVTRKQFFGDAASGRPIAAVRLIRGDDIFLYVHHDGLWRCMQAHGAPALASVIHNLLPRLFEAEGVVQTRRAEDAAAFGIGTDETIRLAFCGPDVLTELDGDVIYALEIGRAITATGGSYVRPRPPRGSSHDSDAIWAINVNMREGLSEERPGVPPMLDPHIVPEAWPGWGIGLQRIVIQHGEETILAERRERELSEEQQRTGEPPWEWIVERVGDESLPGDVMQLWNFTGFLARMPYAGVLAPRSMEEFGLDSPRGAVTLESGDGHALQLIVGGAAGPRGGAIVLNTFTRNVYEVDPAVVQAMLPQRDALLGGDAPPWERWLRR